MRAIRSVSSTCNALCQGGLLTLPDVLPAVPYRGVRRRQRRGAKPSGQRILTRPDGRGTREPRPRLPAPRRSGARVDGMANPGELPINVVRTSKPKVLRGLDQKVRGQVQGHSPSPAVAVEPPANRQSLNHPMIHPWNVVSPSSSLRGRPAARRSPMGRRVEDEGGSEGRPVIGRIGVEPSGEITPRESGLTSLGCLRTRPSEQLAWEAEQMTAASLLVRPPACSARQPQTSIVQVGRLRPTGSREGP